MSGPALRRGECLLSSLLRHAGLRGLEGLAPLSEGWMADASVSSVVLSILAPFYVGYGLPYPWLLAPAKSPVSLLLRVRVVV